MPYRDIVHLLQKYPDTLWGLWGFSEGLQKHQSCFSNPCTQRNTSKSGLYR